MNSTCKCKPNEKDKQMISPIGYFFFMYINHFFLLLLLFFPAVVLNSILHNFPWLRISQFVLNFVQNSLNRMVCEWVCACLYVCVCWICSKNLLNAFFSRRKATSMDYFVSQIVSIVHRSTNVLNKGENKIYKQNKTHVKPFKVSFNTVEWNVN